MIYQGSKARLRKHILPIIQGCIDGNGIETYIEPFAGGANMIDHIECRKRIGSDINSELISLLKYMQKDPLLSIAPEHCTFGHYSDVRLARKLRSGKYTAEYTALIGFFASYGGRYFDGGYGRDSRGGREIYAERLKAAREQAPLLSGIEFRAMDYKGWLKTENAVFYLDPPYRNTKSYSGKKIDYEEFYSFCRRLADKNHVFISEYSMPADFPCVWEAERKVLQRSDRKSAQTAVERLFYLQRRNA